MITKPTGDMPVNVRPDTGQRPDRTAADRLKPTAAGFPSALFDQPYLSVDSLAGLGLPLKETTYLALGGGLGSFCWVDHLVIHGVDPRQIVSLGLEARPYARFKRLCLNSQIPANERLRSDSGSTPDNIWGWPGYAVREICQELAGAHVGRAVRIAWQIFTEPVLVEPYTPRAGAVYASLDRETGRIGWDTIWRFGRVQAVRKLDDGRYAVLYSKSDAHQDISKIFLAPYLHLALGYPGLRYLPDLQAYREETGDYRSVINAYEDHNHVYEHLRRYGGTVLLRGRGIVASRLIQRLYEERAHNPRINILHLVRTPRPTGSRYQYAQRQVVHHFELQPYNFPKACFGGDLRTRLARAGEAERRELINIWGGTTTANRREWQTIIKTGLREGWYQVRFGRVEQVRRNAEGKLLTTIRGQVLPGEETRLQADFIIDATGLDDGLENNPLLHDLVQHYHLERNELDRLRVTENFEIAGLRNGPGRVYASGAMTLGGPFAPVDSFMGLQYAAQQAVNDLIRLGAPELHRLNPIRSTKQWLKWAGGVRP